MIFFVTGGSRGIGAALVVEAARRGHDVAFTYVRERGAAEALLARVHELAPERRVAAYQLDVRDSARVEEVIDGAVDDLGGLDCLVNCAGISVASPLVWMSDEQWDEVIGVNLTGTFYCIRQALPHMIARRRGSIINLSSINRDGAPGLANYSASKAGLHGLTRTTAKEYGRRGIRCNLVIPGFFETDLTARELPASIRDFWAEMVPMPKGRMGHVDEITGVILFLASAEASFINGAVVPVTGGLDWTR